jgi:hypothetical protein
MPIAGGDQTAEMAAQALLRRALSATPAAGAAAAGPKKTMLYQCHVERGGKIVEFGGYLLPVQYKDGIINNHLHVRASAGLFDVSHMGQVRWVEGGGVRASGRVQACVQRVWRVCPLGAPEAAARECVTVRAQT